MAAGGDHHHHADVARGGDFRGKVWSMTGGANCRPKHWKRNTAFAMAGIVLICIPIAMKSAQLEAMHLLKSSYNVSRSATMSNVRIPLCARFPPRCGAKILATRTISSL
ncbi:hypothetical protein SASPL_116128 [Salvia splendens]|uniref:Uncharacterized protein n=1 Tax=Salvia splendens TaxID=180675 RepID=A0A8X9A1X6_SALSN|nr:hypothetical protein SASPL_116128 [Salvia splendens]